MQKNLLYTMACFSDKTLKKASCVSWIWISNNRGFGLDTLHSVQAYRCELL